MRYRIAFIRIAYFVFIRTVYFTPLHLWSIANSRDQFGVETNPEKKIPIPIKWLISPLPEIIYQICKRYSLENS